MMFWTWDGKEHREDSTVCVSHKVSDKHKEINIMESKHGTVIKL